MTLTAEPLLQPQPQQCSLPTDTKIVYEDVDFGYGNTKTYVLNLSAVNGEEL